jgi:hypothetical protein
LAAGAHGRKGIPVRDSRARDDVAPVAGDDAKSQFEARVFEWLLPAVACAFVFASIPRQMRNFFASGLLFFEIGFFRLQKEVFENRAGWPSFCSPLCSPSCWRPHTMLR